MAGMLFGPLAMMPFAASDPVQAARRGRASTEA